MKCCNQCMWCSPEQAETKRKVGRLNISNMCSQEQAEVKEKVGESETGCTVHKFWCKHVATTITVYSLSKLANNTTHLLSHWWYDADQNHKTGQMGCYAANMRGVDDMSLHPSVGPPSSPVALFSCKVKESTVKLLHHPWCHWETLWFHLQGKGSIGFHTCRIVYTFVNIRAM